MTTEKSGGFGDFGGYFPNALLLPCPELELIRRKHDAAKRLQVSVLSRGAPTSLGVIASTVENDGIAQSGVQSRDSRLQSR